MKTKDTYEAAYYLMYGATIVEVEERKLKENKSFKKGYKTEYTFTLSNVPIWARRTFNTDYAYGNISEYIRSRKRLKRYLKKYMLK